MPTDRDSPSGGWREVYDEMGASTRAEADTADCPDCGHDAPRLHESWFWCETHGSFRASA